MSSRRASRRCCIIGRCEVSQLAWKDQVVEAEDAGEVYVCLHMFAPTSSPREACGPHADKAAGLMRTNAKRRPLCEPHVLLEWMNLE